MRLFLLNVMELGDRSLRVPRIPPQEIRAFSVFKAFRSKIQGAVCLHDAYAKRRLPLDENIHKHHFRAGMNCGHCARRERS